MEELLKELLIKKYNKSSYATLYQKFKTSSGETKTIVGDLLAERLVSNTLPIVEEDIDELIDNISLYSVWDLANNCTNNHVKEKARLKIEDIAINSENEDIYESKKSLSNKRKVKRK